MPLFLDKMLKITGNTTEEVQDFQLAWLNRRVEFLEAVVFELLRDKVNYEVVDGYRQVLDNPGFGPNSATLKDRSKLFVGSIQQDFPPENLGWPAKKKWDKDEE